MLYPAEMPDSMLLKQKPLYVTKASGGNFSFRGLPSKQFKIAALSDKNANYLYDAFDEKIAFYNAPIDVRNKDSAIILYSFIEDKMRDTAQAKKGLSKKGPKGKLFYSLNPDIKSKRKMDMQDTLRIQLIDTAATVNIDKIRFYENDVLDLSVAPIYNDSLGIITLYPDWKMGTDYMLILQKAFLKDTSASGTEADTIRFSTMRDEDYSTMVVKVDSALYQADGVLLLIADDVEIRRSNNINKAVRFEKLKPGAYTLRLLYDRNNNGQWDAGELKSRIQPERTIELPQTINLKPNWEEKVEWILGKGKARMGKK
jgi:hypothetical protein